MTRVLKEEKYSNGSLKFLETELHDQPGQRVIFKESWYPPQVDPLNPWQATDVAQQRSGQQEYKENYVNGQKHGVQERWCENGRQEYKKYYLDGVEKSQQAYQSYIRGLAPEIQASTDFGERGLSNIIASYLLP